MKYVLMLLALACVALIHDTAKAGDAFSNAFSAKLDRLASNSNSADSQQIIADLKRELEDRQLGTTADLVSRSRKAGNQGNSGCNSGGSGCNSGGSGCSSGGGCDSGGRRRLLGGRR